MGAIANSALARASRSQRRGNGRVQVLAADKGENKRDLKTLINLRQGTLVSNFVNEGAGRLKKANGYQLKKDLGGSNIVNILGKYNADNFIVSLGTSVGFWNQTSNEVIYFKTDFTNSRFFGVRYGSKFYVANGNDGTDVGYADGEFDLGYDNLAGGSFTLGNLITGGTSGATGVIVADAASTLTLNTVTGNFIDNEALTETASGVATGVTADADGTLTAGWNTISGIPKAETLFIFQNRLYAGNTDAGTSTLEVSGVDTGTGIFSDWTPGTDSGDPYTSRFPNGGDLVSIGNVNSQIVVMHDEGKYGFSLQILDVGTSGLQQNQNIDFQRVDFGAKGKSVSTTVGIFYVNEFGWFLMRGGLEEQVFETNVTSVLGSEYIKEFDFTDADIVHDPIQEKVFVTCKKGSDTNNILLYYDIVERAIGEMPGFFVSRFMRDGNDMYASDSESSKLYKLFDGYDANGSNVRAEYHTAEIDFGSEERLKTMRDLFLVGKLMPESRVQIEVDLWDEYGIKQDTYATLYWTPDALNIGYSRGYSKLPYSKPVSSGQGTLAENMAHTEVRFKRFTKIQFRIIEDSNLPFELNKITPANVTVYRTVKKNNLSQTVTTDTSNPAFFLLDEVGIDIIDEEGNNIEAEN